MSKVFKNKLFILLVFCAVLVLTCLTNAHATTGGTTGGNTTPAANNITNNIEIVLCRAMNAVTGGVGKTFAAFAVIAVGIGFFSGKISWGAMLGIALGIAAMFGAPTIVAALTGEDAFYCDED